MRITLLAAAVLMLAAPVATADMTELDLSGNWYVIVDYKDAKSTDKSITKFRDFVWTVKQGQKRIEWRTYPYVLFDEDTEGIRRHAQMEHLHWEPTERLWGKIREKVEVGSRAATRKTLIGSVAEGFSSESPETAGLNTLSFTRDWKVKFSAKTVRIQIVDSLSGGVGLESMDEATVFALQRTEGPDEIRGTWREGSKRGTFRMVRSAEREIIH